MISYLGLVAGQGNGLDATEEEVEDLQRERVPLVEQRVLGRVGRDGQEEVDEVRLGERLDEPGLERRELGLVRAPVRVRGEVLDEGEVAHQMEDHVHDLHVPLLPLLPLSRKTR